MKVAIVAVGSELLLGAVVNTNAAWLGARLAEAGFQVTLGVEVGDDVAAISDALAAALERADAAVVTGGLGPTQDDVTRAALAGAAGESLPNARGTAPGLAVELAGKPVYALPGVPHEMQGMFNDAVLPSLRRRAGAPAALVTRVLGVAGLAEPAAAAALADLADELAAVGNPVLAFLPAGGLVQVRLTGRAADPAGAERLLAGPVAAVRAALGPAVFSADGESLAAAVHRLLGARGSTVAVAESLTGGLLAAELSAPPGASAALRGGLVTYATELKAALAGVPEPLLAADGPVSPRVAAAMAAGARERLGATYGLATTGVAGPTPQGGAPVGTVHVALAGPGGGRVRSLALCGDREAVRTHSVAAALDLLRRQLEFDTPWDVELP